MTLLHNPSGAEQDRPAVKPHEPLSPFLVEPDAREIFAVYPEIEELHRLPVDLFEVPILTDESLKNKGISREERRAQPVEDSHHHAAKLAVLSAAHILSAVPDVAARPGIMNFIVGEWEEDRGAKADDQIYLRITLDALSIDESVAYVSGLNSYGQTVQRRILESVEDSRANQYQLLRQLVSVQSQESLNDLENGINSPDKQALRWLTLMALVRPDRRNAPVAELLARNLNQGEFDRYIARDMLEYAKHYEGEGLQTEQLATLKNMISLVEHSAGEAADSHMLARLAEGFSLGLWPKEHQRAIYKHRKVLLDTLELLFSAVSEFTSGVMAVEDRDYKAFLYKSFDDLSDIETHSVRILRVVGGTAAGDLKPKRRRDQSAEKPAEDISPSEAETADDKEPLSLMCVDRNGVLRDGESEEFGRLVQDYLDKHKNTPYLEEDIGRILGYLTRLDFSNGAIPGLIRVANGYMPVRINGDEPKSLAVWEFKPKEAQGLSLKSNAATRTRIFLSVVPGERALAIRDIGRRTDSKARTLNKRTGRGRRRR